MDDAPVSDMFEGNRRCLLSPNMAENEKWLSQWQLSVFAHLSWKSWQNKSLIGKVLFKKETSHLKEPYLMQLHPGVMQTYRSVKWWADCGSQDFLYFFHLSLASFRQLAKLHMSYPYVSRLSLWRHLYLKGIKKPLNLWFGFKGKVGPSQLCWVLEKKLRCDPAAGAEYCWTVGW